MLIQIMQSLQERAQGGAGGHFGEGVHVGLLAGGQIVQATHPVSHLQDGLTQVGPNEPRPARDEEKGVLGEL